MASTQKEYVERGGDHCPNCGGWKIEGEEVEVVDGRATQRMNCVECKSEWADFYHLAGYKSLLWGELK